MEPKRTLVRGICAGDRKLFMEKYMELGTCILLKDR